MFWQVVAHPNSQLWPFEDKAVLEHFSLEKLASAATGAQKRFDPSLYNTNRPPWGID